MHRVLITGGSGFIGSHVVDALVAQGCEVTVLDKSVRSHRSDVAHEKVDTLDFASLLRAVRGHTAVFHLAAVANVNHVRQAPFDSVQQNITATGNVLEAARQNDVARVVLASTVWVYNAVADTEMGLLDETTPITPSLVGHLYTSTKLASELLCHSYFQLYGLPFTILRYGIPYGERMREDLLIPSMIRRALRRESLRVTGNGEQYRRFVYVEDLACAHVLALQDAARCQTYNLEGPEKITVLEVAEGIRCLARTGVDIEFLEERAGDFTGREISSKKAHDELGWRIKVPFDEGLQRTFNWFHDKWSYSNEGTKSVALVD